MKNTHNIDLLALFDNESTERVCEACGGTELEVHPDVKTDGGHNIWCACCGYKQRLNPSL